MNIETYDEVQRQLLRRGCLLVDTIGREGTRQYRAVVMMKKTKSGPTLRNNRSSSKQQKNRRIGACIRCTTAARWVTGKTLRRGTQRRANVLRSGARFQHWQGDVADDGNVTIVESGGDRTADDESDEKLYIVWRKTDLSTRPRGCEEKRPHVPKNIGDRLQVSDDPKRFASEVGLR